MDLKLIKKLYYFNMYANLGFQFDGIDKFEKYTIAYHNKIKDYWYNFITDIQADTKEEFDKIILEATPKMKAKNIINVAGKMTKDDDRNYNTIMSLQESGLLETLAKMPREKREKYIGAFSRFMQDREIRNQPKRKVEDNQENTINQQQNDGQVKNNTERNPEKPDTHGEENR